jgi:ribonucleoside-diphosphate reductase alpha chain
MSEYVRTSVQPFPPDGLAVPTNVNWAEKTYAAQDGLESWTWAKEGDENILVTQWNDEVWKFDSSRGLLKESAVQDYAVYFHKKRGTWESDAEWAATAYRLNLKDHIQTMNIFSKYIDSAMSKTVNIPKDYPYEDFKRLYMEVYQTGTIKGCTSYRDGTMLSVLSAESTQTQKSVGVNRTQATPRPKSLPCEIYSLKSNGQKWVVLVGLLQGDPYEVFAMKQDRLQLPSRLTSGTLVKAGSGVYHLETEDGWVIEDISTFFESNEQEALTRMISTALRHGADIEFIVSQLVKSEGEITSFSKAIARTLKKYITEFKSMKCTECSSTSLELREGCFVCLDCGSSKCQ